MRTITKEQLRNKLLTNNIFYDNIYLDKYLNLIWENKDVKKITSIHQIHHIIPKCWYKYNNLKVDNTKDNLVCLSYGKHLLAHWYLWKGCTEDIQWRLYLACKFLLDNSNRFDLNTVSEEELQKIISDLEEQYINYIQWLSKFKKDHYEISQGFIDYIHSLGILTVAEAKEQISKEDFYQYYVIENHTQKDTAKHFRITTNTVDKLRNYWKIDYKKNLADLSEWMSILPKDKLYYLFVIQKLNRYQIMKMVGIDKSSLDRLLSKYDIHRPCYNNIHISWREAKEILTKELFIKLYLQDRWSIEELLEKFDITRTGFERLRIYYDIPNRQKTRLDISKEDVVQYFIVEKHTKEDTIKHFHVGNIWFENFCKNNNIEMVSKNNKGKGEHFYTNGIIQVRRKECPEGFWKGVLPTRCTISRGSTGYKWINKNGIQKTVPAQDVNIYLEDGWSLGHLKSGKTKEEIIKEK